jgi:hypothetical protein
MVKFLSAQPPRTKIEPELQIYLSNIYKEIQNLYLSLPKSEIVTVNLQASGTLIVVDNPIGAVLLNGNGQPLTVSMMSGSIVLTGVSLASANILVYRR